MPLEKGGRADKEGNRYEINCAIYEMLKILDETNYSVVIEALGEDEKATDILVTSINGKKEHQQCKVRNASKEYWDIADLKAKKILNAWKFQLDRDNNRQVALVSPIVCSFLVDLHQRALNTSGKADEFYNGQIQGSSKEFQKFLKEFCAEMNLNISQKNDILKCIDYLRRICYKHLSEYELEERINQYIQFLFRDEKNVVYNALVTFIINGNILGREITQTVLFDYLKNQGIDLRLRDGDKRILPRIIELNKEYRETFIPLQGGLVYRKEFDDCINAIENEKAIIISGRAGYGKSGCTEMILDYCEKQNIPYIAIKLDRRIPRRNCEFWGEELGLSGSIAHAIHCISRNEKAVIILDQLDALRWTQANSSESVAVCTELIQQVKYLNYERKNKIIIVFVCRAYDLENDNNIRTLFKAEGEASRCSWTTVTVQNLEEDIVQNIVGEKYKKLSTKLKKLLKVPSNLYIWQHLDSDESYDDCVTTSHLIGKWYQQICKKSINVGVQEKTVMATTECIVAVLDRIGRLYAPKQILRIEEAGLDYLMSSEMIVVQKNKVGFVHQSILDYFVSKKMMEQYFEGKYITEIIGEKNKQTPGRRYQVQMFLQNLLEYDSIDFLSVGKALLITNDIRYYVKFVFYEILSQILEPDVNVTQFIVENCENENFGDYVLNNVVFSRKQYVTILRRAGFLDKWFGDEKKKTVVFKLLQSIVSQYDLEDVAFIENKLWKNEEDDKQFAGCFGYDITQESDEMFELRMTYYNHYPNFSSEIYIDMKAMMEKCESRAIRLIAFWLQNKIKSKGKHLYRYEEELVNPEDDFLISNWKFVLDQLLQYIPQEDSRKLIYSDWSGKYEHKRGLERACVELVKKANRAMISKSPECFWIHYERYMGKGYLIFNEIILHGLTYLPESFSNQVINYICSDFDKNLFDYTSGAKDELGVAKEIFRVHGYNCDDPTFAILEHSICQYISPRAVEWYKNRIEQNRRKEFQPVYWSFWGDLQYELLQCLPVERLSEKAKELLKVLTRRFASATSIYSNKNGHSGWVKSPISGKIIGKNQWIQIITNQKLQERKQSKWIEVEGGFVESSCEMYSSDLRVAVQKEPEAFITLALKYYDKVLPPFINSIFSGLEYSECLSGVGQNLIEELFKQFPCDLESQRASYFCGILEKRKEENWSKEVLEQLKDIAVKHKDPELEKPNVTKPEDNEMKSCEMLCSNALNCVRGDAARAIGNLLWENKELFTEFKETIDIMLKDENPAVQFSVLYALWPSYNIDIEWTEHRILFLYESDVRMAGFQDSRRMFHLLYPKYKDRVLSIVRKCFNSMDKNLIEVGGHTVSEFYIRYGEFRDDVFNIQIISEEQIRAILDMATIYLGIDEYHELAKDIILRYKDLDVDIEFPLSKIFYEKYVNLEKDKEFLLEIMQSKVSRKVIHAFTHFLEENALSVVDYSDVIIALCYNLLQAKTDDLKSTWGIADELSKLVMSLYDESANSGKDKDKLIAEKCLELWDIMFEKQIGTVREISRKLMER